MKKHKKKAVIVLGVARSGTSVASGMLNILGVDMGTSLRTNIINPKGSFEDKDFRYLINNQIIKSARGRKRFYPFDYWTNPPTLKQINKVFPKFKSQFEQLIEQKSKNKTLWGWKSPATHLIIEQVLKNDLIKNPHLVVVTRNPIDIVTSANTSFWKFSKMSNNIEKLRVVKYHSEIITTFMTKFPKIPRVTLDFENIIKNPTETSKKLSNFLDIEFSNNHLKRVNKFIIPRDKIKKERLKRIVYNHIEFMYNRHIKALRNIKKSRGNKKVIKKELGSLIKLYKKKYGNFGGEYRKSISVLNTKT